MFRGSALLDEQAVLSWNDLHLDVGIHAKAVSEWLGNGDLSSLGDSHSALIRIPVSGNRTHKVCLNT